MTPATQLDVFERAKTDLSTENGTEYKSKRTLKTGPSEVDGLLSDLGAGEIASRRWPGYLL